MHFGEERRMSQDEQLGYITSKVESLQGEVSEFKDSHKEHIMKEQLYRDKIFSKLEDIQTTQNVIKAEITMYKKVFRVVVASIITVSTLAFGDLIKFIKGIF